MSLSALDWNINRLPAQFLRQFGEGEGGTHPVKSLKYKKLMAERVGFGAEGPAP
jgi:hypothetical protein